MLGARASLVCVVRKLGNYTVSWIYKPTNFPERVMVLTSGPEVFSSDQRWKIKVSSSEMVDGVGAGEGYGSKGSFYILY